MNDSVLHQFAARLSKNSVAQSDDADTVDDCGAFGWLRGIRDRALFLELRRKDGSVVAVGYPWLERVEFDGSEGITLYFTSRTVKIVGRNLNASTRTNVQLLTGILRHRVPWIQEADAATVIYADKEVTVIEKLDIS